MPDKAAAASYAGAGFAGFVGYMTFQHWMALFGFLLGVLTFGINAWVQLRKDKREQELHAARLEAQRALIGEHRIS